MKERVRGAMPYSWSSTVRRTGLGLFVVTPILTWLLTWLESGEPWSWRAFAYTGTAALLTGLLAISGRRRSPINPLRLFGGRRADPTALTQIRIRRVTDKVGADPPPPPPPPPGISDRVVAIVAAGGLLAVLLGAGCGGAGGLNQSAVAVPVAMQAMSAMGCTDIEVDVVSDFSKPQDLIVLGDVLRGISAVQAGREGNWERDLVRVILRGCGMEVSTFVAVGLTATKLRTR